MTTITPIRETIALTYTLTAPLHHGAGSSGNTALLRTQEVVQPDGTSVQVPFVSGNSIRHGLRDALAWHLVNTVGVEDGTLTKAEVDLLWSGGAVTATGARTNLELRRQVDGLLASLGLLGFAAQSDIHAGVLRASDLILVAQENAWRLPDELAQSPHAGKRAGAYRSSEFGTRHDVDSTPVARLVEMTSEVVGTTQMIYDHATLKAGSKLHGELSLDPAATSAHRTALYAALALWVQDGTVQLGARGSHGWGTASVEGLPDTRTALMDWTDHLRAHAAEVRALITEVIGD